MRGQVTVFIIIGLIVLILAGFVFSIVDNLREEQTQRKFTEEQQIQQIQIEIQSLANVCFEQGIKQAFLQIGLTGGYFSNGQIISTPYGDFPLQTAIEQEEFVDGKLVAIKQPTYVPFSFDTNTLQPGEVKFYDLPTYPCTTKVGGFSSFNKITMADPEKEKTEDCRSRFSLETETISLSTHTKLPSIDFGNHSLKNMLETYISEYTSLCLIDQNISAAPQASLFFGKEIVEANMDVNISTQDFVIKELETKTFSFPFVDFFSHFKRTMQREAFIPSINFTKEMQLPEMQTIEIEYVKQEIDGKEYTQVTLLPNIEDINVLGEQFVLTFLQENRIPVVQGFPPEITRDAGDVTFRVCAIDPDEEPFSLSVEMKGESLQEEKVSSTCTDYSATLSEGRERVSVSISDKFSTDTADFVIDVK